MSGLACLFSMAARGESLPAAGRELPRYCSNHKPLGALCAPEAAKSEVQMYQIGMTVRVNGKPATVTGSVRMGDEVILLWVRWADGRESALGARELKNVEVVK